MVLDGELFHLVVGDLAAFVVLLADQLRSNTQACCGGGCSNVFQDGFVAVEWHRLPVAADLAVHSVLNGIPLGSSRRVVAHRNGQLVAVTDLVLKACFPGACTMAVAASSVGKDQEAVGVGIMVLALESPPSLDGINGEFGGSTGRPDADEAAIGFRVVHDVGDCYSLGERGEVVVVDQPRRLLPGLAVVLEVADQFPLFGVHADDRIAPHGEGGPLSANVAEL